AVHRDDGSIPSDDRLAQLQRQIFDLHTVFDITRRFHAVLDTDALLDGILLAAIGQLGAGAAAIVVEGTDDPGRLSRCRSKGWNLVGDADWDLAVDSPLPQHLMSLRAPAPAGQILARLSGDDPLHRQLQESGCTLIAPVATRRRLRGILFLAGKLNDRDYTPADVQFLGLVLEQFAVSLDNAMLYESEGRTATQLVEAQQRLAQAEKRALMDDLHRSHQDLSRHVAELNALYDASTALSTTSDLPQLLHDILRLATGVIGAAHGSIMLADHARGMLTVSASVGLTAEQFQDSQLSMGESIAGSVAAAGEPLLIENVETDPRFARHNRHQFESKSLLCVPLKTPKATLGVISLSDKRGALAFSHEDLRLLVTLAAQAAVAIEDAGNFQQVRRQLNEVTALHDLSDRLSEVGRIDQMVMAAFACFDQLVGSDGLQWWQWDEATAALRLYADTDHPYRDDPEDTATFRADPAELSDPLRCMEAFGRLLSALPGAERPQFHLAVPVRSSGRPLGVFVILRRAGRPFTESETRLVSLVAAQAERIFDRQRALWNASRLVTMGNMISEISHDLRKPLTNIRGSLQVLRGRLEPGGDMTALLTATEEEVVRLATLVTELVDFSNPKRYRTERRDVRPILTRALALIGQSAQKHKIELAVDIPPVMRPIFCDENQLTEALLNIFMNAIEAMSGPSRSDGRLTVRATSEPDFATGGEEITIAIADNGPGMTPAELARCFERYYTTKPTGTGLGLAIVERIVQAQDGRIEAESTPGVGTTFRLHFPVR
ncbi:MAG: GAF domain-containing protein, partial [candidate division Zixibacteria bacterium]|nr:GAF domain-containing protein [candidate division Zixibacteria bacterium]